MNEPGPALHLHDPQQAGVFFVTDDDIAVLESVARSNSNGLQVHRIDLSTCSNKDGLFAQLASILQFPSGVAHNWDALSDLLRDLSWLPSSGHVLLIDQATQFRETDLDSFDTLLDILDEASADWREQNRAFWAFLTLPDDEFVPDGQLSSDAE